MPDQVLTPLALDVERGLLLTADQGPTLREVQRPCDTTTEPVAGAAPRGPAELVETWVRVLVGWATLQRSLLEHQDRLVAAGLVAVPPRVSVELAATRADLLHGLPDDDPRRLDAAGRAVVEAALPQLARWAEQVAALGLPLALNHNDLHDNNVFDTPPGFPLRFFDFGDALLTDPLSALRVPVNVLRHLLGCGPGDRRLWRVVDAFCEVWSDLAPAADLRASVPAALGLGALHRHESWLRCQPSMTATELADAGRYAAEWLTMLGEEPVLEPA